MKIDLLALTNKYARLLLKVALWVGLTYALTQWALSYTHQAVLSSAWVNDYLAHLLLGFVLLSVCRSFTLWALTWFLYVAAFNICNALKLIILGSPIMPDDFLAARNMFHLFGGGKLILMWLIVLLPLVCLITAVAWKKITTWVVFCFLFGLQLIFYFHATKISRWLDNQFETLVWNQPHNYQHRGLPIHILQESARNLARSQNTASPSEALAAVTFIKTHKPLTTAAQINHKRNVYAILLESFWDPMALSKAGISKDPLDPRFRKLWSQTNFSSTMTPVFGGYTANSEFEVLCGFPVRVDAVFFEGWLRNNVNCLPAYLGNAGYHSIAAHPNYAAFWNRVNAYNRLGFTTYWSQNDFDLDDMMKNEFLSDASLYKQIWGKIQPDLAHNTPIFLHLVTIFGHVDYPLNEKRPKQITVKNDPNLVEEYVNQIYYKSRELMDFVALLQKEDPNALIVLYGDHLPYLGPNFDGYVDSGLLKRHKGEFSAEMFDTYVSTPLIIINGAQGPVKAGQLPLYQLPSLLLKLLDDQGYSVVQLTENTPANQIRPLPGLALVKKGSLNYLCKEETRDPEHCAPINTWLAHIMTLADDLFRGHQYSLQKLNAENAHD